MSVESVDTTGSEDDKAKLFEALFKKPSIDGMLALSWQDFQSFVGYVFTCAGFTVETVAAQFFPHGPGVDLNLYRGPIKGKPVARVEVRRYAPAYSLDFADVARFLGILGLGQGVPGYMVTTSSFGGPAREAARQAHGLVYLIDGKALLRYIAYIDGSRVEGQYGTVSASPAQPIAPHWLGNADAVAAATARPRRQTRILSISNIKGGVAKTTTALNVGFALADLKKQRVLMIDLDGQGSLSKSLPPPAPKTQEAPPRRRRQSAAPREPELLPIDTRFITDYFLGRLSLQDVIRQTRFEHLWIAPSHPDLYRIQFSGADRTQAELKFVEDLRGLTQPGENGQTPLPFDWIVLDTPAGNTYYGRAALAAADYIVMPAFTEAYAVQGVSETLALTATMGALMGDVDTWKKRFLGCLVTRWRTSANAENSAAQLQAVLHQDSLKVYKPPIPMDDRVETAHRGTMQGGLRDIFRLTPQMGPAARAYDAFVEELLKDVHIREAHPER